MKVRDLGKKIRAVHRERLPSSESTPKTPNSPPHLTAKTKSTLKECRNSQTSAHESPLRPQPKPLCKDTETNETQSHSPPPPAFTQPPLFEDTQDEEKAEPREIPPIAEPVTQIDKLIEAINEERKRNEEHTRKLIESLNKERKINEKLSNMVDEERTCRKPCEKKMKNKLEEVDKGMKTLSENVKSIGNLVSQLHKESRNQNYEVSHAMEKIENDVNTCLRKLSSTTPTSIKPPAALLPTPTAPTRRTMTSAQKYPEPTTTAMTPNNRNINNNNNNNNNNSSRFFWEENMNRF